MSKNESLRLTLTVEEIGEAGTKIFDEIIHLSPQHESVRIYATDATARVRAEEKVKKLNAEMAMRIDELAEVNQELETFNYTVSHDLRSPLNSIGLYSQYLQMACTTLDDEQKTDLQGIINGVRRMSELIDTLLKFSRIAHAELRRENINLSEITRDVSARLYRSLSERKIVFRIADEVTANGDHDLLTVLLENLIGNAVKFTSNQEKSVIEFGMMQIESEQVYFVRDNGIGFDNAYADKLFIPFQRLPGTEEFKGHGVGMSTAARIIKRHGGRIWGEGEPGKGATFYFTVPSEETLRS